MSSGEISNAVESLGGHSADEAVSEFFVAVERDMQWTLATLADVSTVSHETLKDYRRGKCKPGFEAVRKLIAVTPPAIGSLLLSGTGRAVAAVNPNNVADVKLNTRVSKVAAKLAEALEDGFVDHRERRTIVPDMRELRDAADGFIRQAQD